VCVEADSAGHTDGGVALTLLPAIRRLRDETVAASGYAAGIRIGAAGGLGSPEAVAAAFLLGADFVCTGSVNQCTSQAGTSDAVKEMLAAVDVHDTAYAPAGDMFELGARVQVVRRATLFPARATRLFRLYGELDGLEGLDARTRRTIEDTFFRRSIEDVWEETREHYRATGRFEEIARAETLPKRKMALVFRWYFGHSIRLALQGDPAERVNYQIHCGPAMGAFNRFAAGTALEDWRTRTPDAIAAALMEGAAQVLGRQRVAVAAN
jgi:trans-AT polyketide synthase/acyltransferase/oxidoreductase domain-containing protein